MSEMIIPSLAARKAARKKSQISGSEIISAHEMSTITPETLVAPTPPATPTMPEAAPVTAPVEASASSATQVVAEPIPAASTLPESQPKALTEAPLKAQTQSHAQSTESRGISVQSILPSSVDLAKLSEKSKPTSISASAAVSPTISTPISSIANSNLAPQISKELLERMAREMGFELASPKRQFTKHTYSLTPRHKELMKQFTDVLGIAMQDAVCEAFDLFFAKYQSEFDAILKAKGKV
jgi:hypothetical protein